MRDAEFYTIRPSHPNQYAMCITLYDGFRMMYSLTDADKELWNIVDQTGSYDAALEALVSMVAHELIHLYVGMFCQSRPIHDRPVNSLLWNTRPAHDALFSTVSHKLFGMETDCGSRRGWRTGLTCHTVSDDDD